MKILLSLLIACLAWLPFGGLRAGLPETIERVKPSVVGVGTFEVLRRPQAMLMGTGFVVAGGGYVVTNAHVIPKSIQVEKGEHLAVFAGEGKRPLVIRARKLAVDERHDLAVLQLEKERLPAFRLGDSDRVREGEEYAFTGFPIGMVLGLHPVTHRGIVSAITPAIEPVYHARQLDPAMIRRLREPYLVFQLDGTAYPGNSGSPLYDPENGRVVGVINKVFVKESKETLLEKPSGITYAVPVEYVRRLLKRVGAIQ